MGNEAAGLDVFGLVEEGSGQIIHCERTAGTMTTDAGADIIEWGIRCGKREDCT